jgi:hypothetical protein
MSTKCVIDSDFSSLQGCQDGEPAKAGHRSQSAADGSTIEERVRVWDHPSTADWWHRMQAEVSTRQMRLYETVQYTCLSSKHAIQS